MAVKPLSKRTSFICLLLLRGPQTPGELRTRSNRLAEFADVSEVDQALAQLQAPNGDALVVKLNREPGKRESRYAHLFADVEHLSLADMSLPSSESSSPVQGDDSLSRLALLEEQVALLTKQVAELKEIIE